jgi:hypothetical protein
MAVPPPERERSQHISVRCQVHRAGDGQGFIVQLFQAGVPARQAWMTLHVFSSLARVWGTMHGAGALPLRAKPPLPILPLTT